MVFYELLLQNFRNNTEQKIKNESLSFIDLSMEFWIIYIPE